MNPSNSPEMMLRLAGLRSSDDIARSARRRRVLDREEAEPEAAARVDQPPSAWRGRPVLRVVRHS
ncbi:hypothetical protein N865_10510 [Intrasporangium oryzae NRRL B-24470]|uniref:Uncharacterized protein n=1 Tax=Intrasporangium oryzae NRRL B-24470 TaxID=1386089 RepID=W9G607_9MICO|nr:hypothetical protein [Intrasporangium oryzae]EWT01460.1 hypothetical protein N865_10510 [Intrasporangium oryzae NRRL B-24470]